MSIKRKLQWARYEYRKGRLPIAIFSKAKSVVLRTGPSSPSGDAYYGRKAREYDSLRLRQPHWPTEQHSVKTFLANLPRNLDVLDVPFGTGRFAEACLSRGHRLTGVDQSEDMLSEAKKKLGEAAEKIHLIHDSAFVLPFNPNAFDLTICYRFLGSVVPLDAARRALEEIVRVTSGHAILELKHIRNGVPRSRGVTMKHRLYETEVNDLLELYSLRIVDADIIFEHELEVCRSVLVSVR